MHILNSTLLAFFSLALAACGPSGTDVQSGSNETTGATAANTAAPAPTAGGDKLVMELKGGNKVIIKLRPDLAPGHVERVKLLVKEGFYNGHKFHRVIPGFMAQTGDPTGTGAGGSKYPDLKAEFTPAAFERGTIGAARTGNPDSANSQFFICFAHAPHLNGKYTVWGQVVEGMQFIDQVAKGEPPAVPDTIIKMTLE
jgi:peptidylprolyl isomerase